MTDKQAELVNKAKAVLKILMPLSDADRQAVSMIVYQLTDAENRSRAEAEQDALAKEKLAYVNQVPGATAGIAAVPMPPGGLFRG
jgi:hypothetical protein